MVCGGYMFEINANPLAKPLSCFIDRGTLPPADRCQAVATPWVRMAVMTMAAVNGSSVFEIIKKAEAIPSTTFRAGHSLGTRPLFNW